MSKGDKRVIGLWTSLVYISNIKYQISKGKANLYSFLFFDWI